MMRAMSHVTPLRSARPTWTLTDRLIKARRHADLSQTEIGARLGLSQKTIQRYERGDGAPPDRRTVLSFALVCGVDPNWLEHGDNYGPEGGDPVTHPITVGKQRGNMVDNTRSPILLKVAA